MTSLAKDKKLTTYFPAALGPWIMKAHYLLAAQRSNPATDTKQIVPDNLSLNFATSLLLGLPFESILEPVPEEDEVDVPADAEPEVGCEPVAVLMPEPASAPLKILASGESGGRLSKAV